MTGNAGEVSRVDEELVLGDPNGKDIGDVVVGYSVAVSIPVDETINAADAIDDTGSIVGMTWKGHQMFMLVGEAVERRCAMVLTTVDDVIEPVIELGFEVVDISKGATIEERGFELPETALDSRFCVRVAEDSRGAKFVVSSEG
jgi:hypothetical protein